MINKKNNNINTEEEDFSNKFVQDFLNDEEIKNNEETNDVTEINPNDVDIESEINTQDNLQEDTNEDLFENEKQDNNDIIYPKIGEESDDIDDIQKIDKQDTDSNNMEDIPISNLDKSENTNDDSIDLSSDIQKNNELSNDLLNNNQENNDDINLSNDNQENNNSLFNKISELKNKKGQIEEKVHGKKNFMIISILAVLFIVLSIFIIKDIIKTFSNNNSTTNTETISNQTDVFNSNLDNNKTDDSKTKGTKLDELLNVKNDGDNNTKQTDVKSDLDILIESDSSLTNNFSDMLNCLKKYEKQGIMYSTLKSTINDKINNLNNLKTTLTSNTISKQKEDLNMVDILNKRIDNQLLMYKDVISYIDTDKGIPNTINVVNKYIPKDNNLKNSQNITFIKILNDKNIEYSTNSNGDIILNK